MKDLVTISDLVRLHHQPYEEDIPFWISRTKDDSLILELGCGHGRVSIPLAKEGKTLVGIDQDWEALSILNSIVESQQPDLKKRIQLIQANLLHFHSPPVFDSVILPCNTFSTFAHTDRMLLLNSVTCSLRPGGSFIASIPNPELGRFLSQSPFDENDFGEAEIESLITHPESGLPVQVRSRMVPTQGGMILEWIYDLLLPDGNVERYIKSTEHYLELPEVYLNEFSSVGLTIEAYLGDFSGDDYDQDSPYLILIAKSP
jgi:SAM-dependent methyltransferase